MKKVVHRKGIVKQVGRIAGKIGRSWKPKQWPFVPVKADRYAAKAV